jgi:hypothetical protein
MVRVLSVQTQVSRMSAIPFRVLVPCRVIGVRGQCQTSCRMPCSFSFATAGAISLFTHCDHGGAILYLRVANTPIKRPVVTRCP